ncbi:MarR family winged helix-turn-helix transcriptional regulator [Streptomyces sp. NPDC048420]|uniref:MarR family winged helix-turn-helix transcriptional regulator n=1 Tax=Streptomyces sp. NPDC048420 TaxID=3155755 RepID=UPI003431D810
MDTVTASQAARPVEAKQLITREQDQHDARIKRLHVADEGIDLAQQAIVRVEAIGREYFGVVPDGTSFGATSGCPAFSKSCSSWVSRCTSPRTLIPAGTSGRSTRDAPQP